MSCAKISQQQMNEIAGSTIVTYLHNPFSSEALAEARKTWVDLGRVSVGDTYSASETIKNPDEAEQIPNDVCENQKYAHELFFEAAEFILGAYDYNRSTIKFVKRSNNPAAHQRSGRTILPHLDGIQYGASPVGSLGCLRIVGIASDTIPTVILQGPLQVADLTEKGFLKSSEKAVADFEIEALPTSHLVLLSPSTLHCRSADARATRSFVRWQLYL